MRFKYERQANKKEKRDEKESLRKDCKRAKELIGGILTDKHHEEYFKLLVGHPILLERDYV